MKKFLKIVFVFFVISMGSIAFAQSGKDIFDRYCTTCHSPSMAPMFNSPAAHDLNAWEIRINDAFTRAYEKDAVVKNASGDDKLDHSINELLSTAKEGTPKGMPPKGTCMECSDEELKSVIRFMSSEE